MTALTEKFVANDPVSSGRTDRKWETFGLVALLTGTAFLFIWGLDRNGWANPYYSAAVQAGSVDWKAFLVETETVGPNTIAISAWVSATFTEETIDGTRIFDLSLSPRSHSQSPS